MVERTFSEQKAKEETVVTTVENLLNFSQCFFYSLTSLKYLNTLLKPSLCPPPSEQHFCVRSNANLVCFRYWDVSVWWILPSEQVKKTRNEAICVLVCINGHIGMFFQIGLFH